MRYGIGRLEMDGGRMTAHIKRDGAVTQWVVSNPMEIPEGERDDCEYHLFRYDPQDQFCHYVSMDDVESMRFKTACEA